jgi:histidyl-tRNA synthetase
LSLARGLDYYTGIIYEAVVEASAPPAFHANASAPVDGVKKTKKVNADGEEEVDESTVGVGSIAAGGRYDNLVGMFTAAAAGEPSGKKEKVAQLPCVGASIGMDRIFALVWPKWIEKGMRSRNTMAFVLAAGDSLLKERVELVRELREAGIEVGG